MNFHYDFHIQYSLSSLLSICDKHIIFTTYIIIQLVSKSDNLFKNGTKFSSKQIIKNTSNKFNEKHKNQINVSPLKFTLVSIEPVRLS